MYTLFWGLTKLLMAASIADAAIPVRITSGFVQEPAIGIPAVTLCGADSFGRRYVLTAHIQLGRSPVSAFMEPGHSELNLWYYTSGDFPINSLSIDEVDVPLLFSPIVGSEGELRIAGPPIEYPPPPLMVTKVFETSVWYDARILLFHVDNPGIDPAAADWILSGSGHGIARFTMSNEDPNGASTLYIISSAEYGLGRAVPEPLAIILWLPAILIVCIIVGPRTQFACARRGVILGNSKWPRL